MLQGLRKIQIILSPPFAGIFHILLHFNTKYVTIKKNKLKEEKYV